QAPVPVTKRDEHADGLHIGLTSGQGARLLEVGDALVGTMKDRAVVVQVHEAANQVGDHRGLARDRSRGRVDDVPTEQRLTQLPRHGYLVDVGEGEIQKSVGTGPGVLTEAIEQMDAPVVLAGGNDDLT